MINTMDEDGNYVELGGEFPLEENEHFNNLLVNTQQSNIQVPTNVYNKGQRSTSSAVIENMVGLWMFDHHGDQR